MLVRTNAQLAPIEAALTRAGDRVPGARPAVLRPARGRAARSEPCGAAGARTATGLRLLAAIRRALGGRRWATRRRRRRRRGTRGPGAAGALETLLAIVDGLARGDPHADARRASSRSSRRRAAHERDGLGGRRQPPDLPPREGPRVGRGVPADARGGLAADPPGDRRRRGARRGAPAAVRRDHPGAGRTSRCRGRSGARRAAARRAASRAGSCSTSGRARRRAAIRELPGPPVARAAPQPRPGDDRTTRCSRRSASGATGVARDEAMPPYVDRPRRDAGGDRRGRPRSLGAPAPGEGHGPDQAREVRRRDPRGPRLGRVSPTPCVGVTVRAERRLSRVATAAPWADRRDERLARASAARA